MTGLAVRTSAEHACSGCHGQDLGPPEKSFPTTPPLSVRLIFGTNSVPSQPSCPFCIGPARGKSHHWYRPSDSRAQSCHGLFWTATVTLQRGVEWCVDGAPPCLHGFRRGKRLGNIEVLLRCVALVGPFRFVLQLSLFTKKSTCTRCVFFLFLFNFAEVFDSCGCMK